MNVEITHIKKRGGRIAEVGAMHEGRVVWRATIGDAIARYRTGVRYFITVEGKAYEVQVSPGSLLEDAHLFTPADKVCQKWLDRLPELPQL